MTASVPAGDLAARGSATGWLAVGVAGVGVVALAGRAVGLHVPACTLRAHTGVACPACGLTRLVVGLGHGHVGQVVAVDLPGVLLVAAVVGVLLAQLASVAGHPVPWLRRRWVPVALAALVAAHWALTAVTGGLPSTA